VLSVPLVARAPLQSPVAVQLVALLEDQASCDALPCTIAVGFAVRLSVGAGTVTLTVTVRDAVPPGPVQVSTNPVVAFSAALVAVPDVGRAPVQPPDAVQLVAPVVLQVSVVVPPCDTDAGLAVRLTVGNGAGVTSTCTDCAAVPPAPVHVRVKVDDAVSAPLACDPDNALAPVHAPEAVQLVALLVAQLSVLVPPYATVVGDAPSVIVGGGVGAGGDTVIVVDWLADPPCPVHVRR